MGLADDLGYTAKRANPLQRAMQAVGASRPGAWVFQWTLFAVDRPLWRATGGRLTVPGLVTGVAKWKSS